MQPEDVGLSELTIPACFEIGVTATFAEVMSKSGWANHEQRRREAKRASSVEWGTSLKRELEKKIGFFKESPDLKITVQKIINTTKKNWGTKGNYRPADLFWKWMHFYLQILRFVFGYTYLKEESDLTKRLVIARPRPMRQQPWQPSVSSFHPISVLA